MDSTGMSKIEYLKKYLGRGEKKKKKKKLAQSSVTKSKIVDDDIDLKSMKPIDENELNIYDLAEEAPQIVGVIDERPEEVRLMSEFRNSKKWKVVADGLEDVKITPLDHMQTEKESPREEKGIPPQKTKDTEKKKSDSGESPPRSKKSKKSSKSEKMDKIEKNDKVDEKKSDKTEKTLSGKKAGLQSAEEMKKEAEKLRKKEKEIFEKMSDDMTGKHATAIVRNRKTGRRHDAKEEARKKREEEEKKAEKIAQYAVWGKGVKQVQDRQDKIKDDLYEMSKPLARYRDDKDLEEMLKNQEREGDPMLEYIRRKRKKTEPSKPSNPEYEGAYFPNRYGIKPGHKWDGVDRSNGYEKKWFEEQSAKKAREEEAFKWSTYDM